MDVQQGKMELTPAETQTLKKCLDSSFWTHSIPLSIGTFGIIKYAQVKRNYQPKWWTTTAMLLSSVIAGRIMAMPKCIDAVLQENPEGNFAKQMEEMKSKKNRDKDVGFARDSQDQALVSDPDAARRPSSLPNPSLETPTFNKQTYDDLRRRNREEYISKKRPTPSSAGMPEQYAPPSGDLAPPGSYYSDPISSVSSYSDPPSPYMDSTPLIPPSTTEEEPKVRRKKRVNIYGDEIED